MESYFTGGSEECNSCESGWTTYIASPMHDDDASADSGDAAAAEDDSDDSMASDASSGPSHQEQYYGAVHEMDSSENDDEGENEEDRDEGDVECSEYSHEKSDKGKEKSRGRMDLKKENPIHLARKTDPVCTSSKVTKTNSMTKAN